ncbi:TIGR02206 family membrane protein [Gorillibacterium sp. CAU 1737]|uniref:YwaF family protein n=1 Tax=Gorillibacterium sp. CAU 1737 TaxID=3140362 RepID=UPI0032604472
MANRNFSAFDAPDFTAYSAQHYAAIGLSLLMVLLLYGFRRSLKDERRKRIIRGILAGTLIVCELSLNVWYLSENVYSAADTLPLELCSISLYVAVIMLLTNNRRLFPFVYFAGISGALQAILTPALDYGFPHYRYLEFFIAHLVIILSALYMVWVEGIRPTLRSMFAAFGWLNALLVPVGLVNRLSGGNYMFISRKPETASLLDVLGPYPWYLLSLEAVALLLFGLLYVPFAFRKRDTTE